MIKGNHDRSDELNNLLNSKLIEWWKYNYEFTYEYRTDKAGYSFLRDLAHIYNKTPYFPDKWRIYLQH